MVSIGVGVDGGVVGKAERGVVMVCVCVCARKCGRGVVECG